MTEQQKEFIEKNIGLIKRGQWEDFFKDAPGGIGEVLYVAGIDFMGQMEQVPNFCFDNSSLTNIDIPDNITIIGDYAFSYCSELTSVTIPDRVESIGGDAFRSCTGLTSVTIGKGVNIISDYAFCFCDKLTSIDIPDNVTRIGESAFRNCIGLKNIAIPSSVTIIDKDAFMHLGPDDVIINFNGTKEQWKNIYNSKAFTRTHFKVNCLDGKLYKKS